MFNFHLQPQMQLINPPFTIIGIEPRPDHPGKVGISLVIPSQPTNINLTILFDRNQSEEFLANFRKAMDTSKGVKV